MNYVFIIMDSADYERRSHCRRHTRIREKLGEAPDTTIVGCSTGNTVSITFEGGSLNQNPSHLVYPPHRDMVRRESLRRGFFLSPLLKHPGGVLHLALPRLNPGEGFFEAREAQIGRTVYWDSAAKVPLDSPDR